MPQKSKYTVDEEVKLVEDDMAGRLSLSESERIYESGQRILRDWVGLYKTRGLEGLAPAVHRRKYPPETKQSAVLDYLRSCIHSSKRRLSGPFSFAPRCRWSEYQ